jgi:hypothetical protein
MAKLNVKTEVEGPDEIKINLVREDYLETSNTYRIFFEICLAITGAILGNVISIVNESKTVPTINWIFLTVMICGCIAFLLMTGKNYKKAKSQVNTSE